MHFLVGQNWLTTKVCFNYSIVGWNMAVLASTPELKPLFNLSPNPARWLWPHLAPCSSASVAGGNLIKPRIEVISLWSVQKRQRQGFQHKLFNFRLFCIRFPPDCMSQRAICTSQRTACITQSSADTGQRTINPNFLAGRTNFPPADIRPPEIYHRPSSANWSQRLDDTFQRRADIAPRTVCRNFSPAHTVPPSASRI